MKKKLVTLLMVFSVALAAHAQFEEGKVYVGASLTGLVAYSHNDKSGMADAASVGLGGRYYIIQNGLYLGANCRLIHANHSYNDIMPGVEVGYAFF